MNPSEQQAIAEAKARRDEVSFDRLERWILTEFCAAMRWRASEKRTRRLHDLSARANQLLRDRAALSL